MDDRQFETIIEKISNNGKIRTLYALGAVFNKKYYTLDRYIKPDGNVDIEACKKEFEGCKNLYLETHLKELTKVDYYILAIFNVLNLKSKEDHEALINCINNKDCGIITEEQRIIIKKGLETLFD